MKKLIVLVCFVSFILCACGSDTVLLGSYTVVTSGQTSDASSMLDADTADGFSLGLGLVSISDSEKGIGDESADDLESTEILLISSSDGDVICADNVYTEIAPASTTKILTALTALKYTDNLDEPFTLTDAVYVDDPDAQLCGFEAGDVVTMRTLLYSMLVYSGNDAANAVAYEAGGGSISDFCDMMNEEARVLGATHTHFVTPHGLDDSDHYTTAYDLYLIFRECLKNDVFADAISLSSYTANFTRDGEDCSLTFQSSNYYMTGRETAPEGVTVIGGKTGTTSMAGSCLILYARDEEDQDYIAVILGAADRDTLYKSMTILLSNINK